MTLPEPDAETRNRELKQAIQLLSESRERYMTLYDRGPVGYLLLNEKGLIRGINRTGCALLQRQRKQLLGTHFSLCLDQNSQAKWMEHLATCRRTSTRVKTELPFLTPENKQIWVEISTEPDQTARLNENRFLSTLMDISERKQIESALFEYRDRMVLSAKMADLGEMAAGIVHEINNALSIIQGNSALLREVASSRSLDPDRVRALTERIERTTQKMARIVQGVKSFSRDGAGDPFELVTLKSVVDDALDLLSAQLKRQGVEFARQEIPESVLISCRPSEICQVLINLVSNAIDAVETSSVRWVRLGFAQTEECFEVSVTDSGAGVPSAIRHRILEPFFTTKKAGKGTGLGLSISSGIMDNHGGSLFLDPQSSPTRFVIRLPIVS